MWKDKIEFKKTSSLIYVASGNYNALPGGEVSGAAVFDEFARAENDKAMRNLTEGGPFKRLVRNLLMQSYR